MYFSVIVPIYCVAEYLRPCVDSILNQTFSDFELILVDDGSSDECPAICDDYAKKDGRVRVVHQPNGGQAKARKTGLEIARGQYIVYIDADDMVRDSMLEDAYQLTEKYGADMVSFGYAAGTGSDESGYRDYVCEAVPEGYYDREAIKKEIWPRLLLDLEGKAMSYTLWIKAIRRTVLYGCQMAVDERSRLCEDIMCVASVCLQAESIYISHKTEYYYRQRPESCSHFFKASKFSELILGLEFFDKLCPDEKWGFAGQIDRYALSISFNMLDAAAKTGDKTCLPDIEAYFNHPVLKNHIAAADLANGTKKTRIAMGLMKKNRIRAAWFFLRLCSVIRGK